CARGAASYEHDYGHTPDFFDPW
nr:immunoglobulin heavy chain junction region [Macaca mulatta]MOY21895.1 immunoglobulin heavy chain junction region [Macaca mulatta]MOY22433.1 immunoglobulin heavy chain junction region [Macaca mulatta]MOY23044.1 immunoglobulin heavy chain junction region [Macaca mulatta]MOY23516.1 immunoglobulin heavy chain junction region [Macaca mulatta]